MSQLEPIPMDYAPSRSPKNRYSEEMQPKHSASYTRFVHVSKFTLSMVIIAILVFVVLVPLLGYKQTTDVVLEFGEVVDSSDDAPPVMLKPRFQGVDAEDQPYLVTANTAVQQSESTIILDQITADLTSTDGSWLALIAQQGTLEMEEQSLLLQGDVQIYHDAGHEMRTEQMRIDLDRLSVFGESPVQIQGQFGHIRSDRFTILDNGDRMMFQQNVFVMLLP